MWIEEDPGRGAKLGSQSLDMHGPAVRLIMDMGPCLTLGEVEASCPLGCGMYVTIETSAMKSGTQMA